MEKLSDKEWWALRRYSTAPLSEIWRDAIDIVLTHRPVSYTADRRAEITPLVRALRDIRMSNAGTEQRKRGWNAAYELLERPVYKEIA
jgi:hypothetical protein